MTTISVIENNAKHLQIISHHIKQNPSYTLLSTATNGFEFVNYCYHNIQLPQVALIDVEMDVMDGVTLVDFLTQYFPSIKCVAVTSHTHKEMIEDMMACGAMGIVFKLFTNQSTEVNPEEYGLAHKFESLDTAIEIVVANNFYLDKLIAKSEKKVVEQLNREQLIAHRQQQRNTNILFDFKDKEEVIMALCAGTSAKLSDIAGALSMSVQNIKAYQTNIFKKVGAKDRLELTHFCNRKGIVKNARNLAGKEQL